MWVTRGESEFEVSISPVDSEWEGKIVENNLSRVVPTVHLCHNWASRDARCRWRAASLAAPLPDEPDEDRPDFQEALIEPMPSSDASHNL